MREKVTGKVLGLDESLRPVLPPLLALLDLPVDETAWQKLDPPQRRQRTLDAIKRLLLTESRVQPLLVVFEDLHWIDSETQAALDSLVESLPTARLLLLVNYRPEYQHAWASKTYYRQLQVDPLAATAAGDLLRSLLGEDPSLRTLVPLLIQRTEGNPFFLEESVRTMMETGILVGAPGATRLVKALPEVQVPASVQAVLAARIDRLAPEDKRLLQAAAVIGKDVSFALLSAIAEVSEGELRGSLARLQAAEFLYEMCLFPHLEYTFKHALTHQVTYEGLLHDRRRALHARVATALKTLYQNSVTDHVEALAYHTLRGELWNDAVTFSRQAGVRAFSRAANREAAVFLRQALSALANLESNREVLEQSVDIRLELRHPLFALGDQEGIRELLHEAEARAITLNDQVRLARVLTLLANYFWYRANHEDALGTSARVISIANESGDLGLRVSGHFRYGQASHATGEMVAHSRI